MTYLLDTHIFLWAITDPEKLSSRLRQTLTSTKHNVLISAVSFWEISLKFRLGKLKITGFSPEELPTICEKTGFEIIPLLPAESSSYHQLQVDFHKDPFDRMLIWQAISNGYTFVSHDKLIEKYSAAGLKFYKE